MSQFQLPAHPDASSSQTHHYPSPPTPNPLYRSMSGPEVQSTPLVPPTPPPVDHATELGLGHLEVATGLQNLSNIVEGFVNSQNTENGRLRAALLALAERLEEVSLANVQPSVTPTPTDPNPELPNPPPIPNPPAPVHQGAGNPPGLKLPEVKKFSGRPEDVREFLQDVEGFMYLNRRSYITERDKVFHFATFLDKGSAKAWFSNIKTMHTELLDDFEAFVAAFRKHFDQSNVYSDTTRRLAELKQTTSAARFTTLFLELVARLDWTDQTKIEEYWKRLRTDVRHLIMARKGRHFTKNFEEFYTTTIQIDQELFDMKRDESRMFYALTDVPKTHRTFTPPFSPLFTTTVTVDPPQPLSGPAPTAPQPSASDVVPMEIDALKLKRLTPEEKKRRRDEGLCLYCGIGKHLAASCPNKKTKTSPSSGKV